MPAVVTGAVTATGTSVRAAIGGLSALTALLVGAAALVGSPRTAPSAAPSTAVSTRGSQSRRRSRYSCLALPPRCRSSGWRRSPRLCLSPRRSPPRPCQLVLLLQIVFLIPGFRIALATVRGAETRLDLLERRPRRVRLPP